jgi:xanthine dehydrogenase accessory factor
LEAGKIQPSYGFLAESGRKRHSAAQQRRRSDEKDNAVNLEILHQLNVARAARQGAVLVTEIGSGEARLVVEGAVAADDLLGAEIVARFASGVSGLVDAPNGRSYFLTVAVPPPCLVVIGAVHISQALAPMARIAGFDMTIIDPRTAFATSERFPDVPLLAEWPVDAIAKVGLDGYTALAALTHDPKIDDAALVAALAAGCFYVGALGSRKTHASRLERLGQAGVATSALATIRAPIGLPIAARSPPEIAVAILAEIIAALRRRGEPST